MYIYSIWGYLVFSGDFVLPTNPITVPVASIEDTISQTCEAGVCVCIYVHVCVCVCVCVCVYAGFNLMGGRVGVSPEFTPPPINMLCN